MTPTPTASNATVREVIERLDSDFSSMAHALENGEFALWVGSGISRRAPSLGDLIGRAIEFLRLRANDPVTSEIYLPSLKEAIVDIAGRETAELNDQLHIPFADWPTKAEVIDALWNNYSRVLDIRVKGEPADYVLWEAIDIRTAFANPAKPAAEHLCIAVLIIEGAVRDVASANWDGFIEAAIADLAPVSAGLLQVVVDPNHLRDVAGRARLLKFHGCIVHASENPTSYRDYLVGSRTQITEWPDLPKFSAIRNAVIDVATNQKALVLGLSIQDNNIQSVFSKAKLVNPWPWPCVPNAPGHIFCEEAIKQGQIDVLKIVYGDSYNEGAEEIQASAHLRAWAEQVLIALVLKLIATKLEVLMDFALAQVGGSALKNDLTTSLNELRDSVADKAIDDRTEFCYLALEHWSALLSIFRTGSSSSAGKYEALSFTTPNQLAADANAMASRFGNLAIALSLLHRASTMNLLVLESGVNANGLRSSLAARGTWTDAPKREIFLVKSAGEAITLGRDGALPSEGAIVVHSDDTWHRLRPEETSSRGPGGAPGRTGRVKTTHVSLGVLLEAAVNSDSLAQQLVSEMTI